MITKVDNRLRRKSTSFCGVCGKPFRWYKPSSMHWIIQAVWGSHIHRREHEVSTMKKRSIFQ